jgi:tetratricopeptide (TPR) repeat protein
LREKPDHPQAARDYFALGRCQVRLGRIRRGLASLDKASELFGEKDFPERYLAAMEAGWAARKAGMPKRALAYFEKARSLTEASGDQAQALYEAAQSLRKLGQNARVAAAFQELAKMDADPWSPMAQRHLADMKLAPALVKVGR